MDTKRYGYICATDIPPICGFQKWRTQFDVWNEKVSGTREEDNTNEGPKKWGQKLEPVIAAEFEERTGKKVKKADFFVACPIHRHACSPDYFLPESGGKEILECKTTSAFAAKIWGNPDIESEAEKIPDEYYLQVQWQLRCTGAEICWVALLIGGNDFRIYKIKRNEKLIKKLKDKANDFWQTYVEPGCMPPAIGSEKENKYLDTHMKESNREIFEADLEESSLLVMYRQLKQKHEKAGQELEQCKAEIKQKIGDRGGLLHDTMKVTWYEQKGRKSTSYAKILKELNVSEELIQKHTKIGKPMRVFKFEEIF